MCIDGFLICRCCVETDSFPSCRHSLCDRITNQIVGTDPGPIGFQRKSENGHSWRKSRSRRSSTLHPLVRMKQGVSAPWFILLNERSSQFNQMLISQHSTISHNIFLFPSISDLEELDLRSNDKYCPAERSALAAFYTDLKGSEWLDQRGWLTNAHREFLFGWLLIQSFSFSCLVPGTVLTDIILSSLSKLLDCTWSGVTCTADRKKVVGLNLSTNGVTGQIPKQFFQKLKDLEGKG